MAHSWLRIYWMLVLMPLLMTPAMAANEIAASSKGRPSPVLLVLGDSISAGYGLEPQQGWVSLLRVRLAEQGSGFKVVNASISGDTTNGGLSRLPRLLQEHRPQILVLELGANDGLRGAPLQLIEANLKRLIKLGQQAGAQVLLLGMQIPPNYGSRYSEGFFQLFNAAASATGSAYLPFLLEGVGGVPGLMQADGLHPNRVAQPRLLDNSWVALQPLLNP